MNGIQWYQYRVEQAETSQVCVFLPMLKLRLSKGARSIGGVTVIALLLTAASVGATVVVVAGTLAAELVDGASSAVVMVDSVFSLLALVLVLVLVSSVVTLLRRDLPSPSLLLVALLLGLVYELLLPYKVTLYSSTRCTTSEP